MTTTTRSDIPGYDVVRPLDELRNPVYEVRRMPSEDIFVAKVVGPEYEPYLPGQRSKLGRRLSRIVGTTVGWVRIDDHGTTADGQPFVISPLFERGSLADRLDGPPTPWAEAVRWISAAALSLGNLHDEGIALGRLRPSAVLLSDDDEALIAVYGLASRSFDDGTFRFEAPEVLSGGNPEPTSDTYSLALILTALLIGRTPVFGEQLDDYVQNLAESCPESVREVITRSLSQDPDARYRSGTDFAHGLRGIAEQTLAAEYSELTVTTHFSEKMLANHIARAEAISKPPKLPQRNSGVDPAALTAHPVGSGDDPTVDPVAATSDDDPTFDPVTADDTAGPLTDLYELAAVTIQLDESVLNESVGVPSEPHQAPIKASPDNGISAEQALAELDDLITSSPGRAGDNNDGESDSTAPNGPADTKAAPSDGHRGTDLPSVDRQGQASLPAARSDESVPFIASPSGRGVSRPGSSDHLRAVAGRLEGVWYANRRTVASALTALAVAGIGVVAVLLAFRSYQDGQTAAVEGAPVPTTEPVIMANLNDDVVFITEPPQTNTTTTTAPPRRRTTTTVASSTTAGTKPVDDKSKKPVDDDDDDDAPPTTADEPDDVPELTIPPEIIEEIEERGRGRNRRP